MARQNLVVEFLLITTSANLICSVEIPGNGWQSTATQQFSPFPPSSHLVLATLPHSHAKDSIMPLGEGTEQTGSQITPSVPEAEMITAESVPSTKETAGHTQEKTTVASEVIIKNPMYETGEAPADTAIKAAAAAKTVRGIEPLGEIHREMKTVLVTGKTTSKAESSDRQKTTALTPADATGNAKNILSRPTSNHTTTASKGTSITAHKNRTSILMSTSPPPTAPVGPTLGPKPSPAALGTYSVSNGTADCVKAVMGLTMIVKNKRRNLEYYNIDPNSTHTVGICGPWLSTLKISFEGGFIRFSFTKDGEVYYVSVIEATLEVPSEGSLYSGLKSDQLFSTPVGNSFKCSSKQTMDMSDNLQLLVANSQLQAFDIAGNQFGKEEVCTLDKIKKLIPAVVSFSLAGLVVILIVTCTIYRRKPNRGYDRI
nr:lysosome-associated membrane glycoprotein 3 [Pogona vitticeps]